ncbi:MULTISPECIES: DNA adenine methylase [unclassified Modicisalibacter]|uniref:DNA adenine methylase n=1 Tax=unclassified Modicisalibacter TaxID=2679913 RepID=UPI001CCD0F60|nr:MULTISPECIES: DNA adenine methylase [unclassified Modicisalibacter]MBZ9559033.1 DNA adenine methylase [Modicisalibacter sp. R2A 31.J]MBZ9576855.1 DNA adenine methylase [Modicisalibacter sp. MOD 31.J]
MTVSAPLMRYHGGKFRLAKWIMAHFPPATAFDVYVESFGGAAGVLLQKPRSYAEVYNDLDGEVTNLFEVLRHPRLRARLVEAIRLTPYARHEFEQAFEMSEEPVESARRVLIRAQMGFGSAGATRGNSGFRTDTRRVGGTPQHHWQRMPLLIEVVAERLSGVLIENRDALSVIAQHDSKRTLHYVDPPYPEETREKDHRSAYRYEMSNRQHLDLLDHLMNATGFVLLSGYDCDLYRNALRGWRMARRQTQASGQRGSSRRTECLWLNPRAAEWAGQLELGLNDQEVAHG